MARKHIIEHGGIRIWRVYDGSDPRSYFFTWDKDHTEDGDDKQFDVRDLSTFDCDTQDSRHAKKAIIAAIDKGEIVTDGPIPRDDNSIEEHRPEKIKLLQEAYETGRKQLWNEMKERFKQE
jgi:hypothetical protein